MFEHTGKQRRMEANRGEQLGKEGNSWKQMGTEVPVLLGSIPIRFINGKPISILMYYI
jgi:hypothetical protein